MEAQTTERLDEAALRRPPLADDARPSTPGFRPGVPVVLGDGQAWTIPRPRALFRLDLASDRGFKLSHDLGPGYDTLVGGLDDARDAGDGAAIIRAELRLGWHLLSLNYSLTPEQGSDLLAYHYPVEEGDGAPAGGLFGVDCRPSMMAVVNGRTPPPKA